MIKPKFLLSFGIGWSGTTSLYHTLKEIKYLHTGLTKENYRLATIHSSKNLSNKGNFYWDRSFNIFTMYLNVLKANDSTDNIIKQFTIKDAHDIAGPSATINHYVNFYRNLSKYCGNEYQCVGDFSNTNLYLDTDFLIDLRNKLSEYFDVKCIIILRDPIRRAWSNAGSYTQLNPSRFFYHIKDISKDVIRGNSIQENIELTIGSKYVSHITKLYDIFDKENVCYLIMEDFFNLEKNEEKEKLEYFLNIKIDSIYPCCYVPDRGINAPKLENLRDQWDSDVEILTPEIYNNYRNREDISKVYSDFKKFHGFLPADWGSPIDYGYD